MWPRFLDGHHCRLLITGALVLALAAACGPKCPEVKAKFDDVQITTEDVARVNRLVEKRKAAIAEASAPGKGTFAIDRLRFSVTGYELAIETQLRVIKISPKFDNSPLYKEYRPLFDEMRCFFDTLVAEPEKHVLADAEGRDIRRWSERVGAVLRKEGRLGPGELAGYLEEGIRDKGGEE